MNSQILNTRTVRLSIVFGIAILIMLQLWNKTNAQESPTPTSTPVDKTPTVLFRLETALGCVR